MPEIRRFLGFVIRMYYHDHSQPHFHAMYGAGPAAAVSQALAAEQAILVASGDHKDG